jgi:predicted AlkP superfamily phosphohydrolase/phosphomutase
VCQNDVLLVCSDHGFSPVHTKVYINNWLESLGLLAISKTSPEGHKFLSAERIQKSLVDLGLRGLTWKLKRSAILEPTLRRFVRSNRFQHLVDMEWAETYAYFGDGSDGLIWLNAAGREPQGIVTVAQRSSLQQQIIQAALQLRDSSTGQLVIRAAFTGDELFGAQERLVPDVALLPNEGYRLVGSYRCEGSVFAKEERRTANHALEGIFAACGAGLEQGVELHGATVADITPTILRRLGLNSPVNMDGKPLLAVDTLYAFPVSNTPAYRPGKPEEYRS